MKQAFGFLASKEVSQAGVGNLGLQDRESNEDFLWAFLVYTKFAVERFALKWIQKYISAFGGDPTKVTMWVLGKHFSNHSCDS